MIDTPKLSVIIATHNRANYIRETVESIFGQRFRDYELIVIDDGSTDGTRKVLEPYDSQLRYIYQENAGPSTARNVGVRYAKAPWLAFQNSDDLSQPDHLATCIRMRTTIPAAGWFSLTALILAARSTNERRSFLRKSHIVWPLKEYDCSTYLKRASSVSKRL